MHIEMSKSLSSGHWSPLRNLLTLSLLILSLAAMSACSGRKDSTGTPMPAPKTDIFTAVVMNDAETVKQHIAAGTDLDAKDPFGSTALITAAAFDRSEIVSLLLNAGADTDLTNSDGSTALHTAAFFCRTSVVERLLQSGAAKDLTNNYGQTALQSVSSPWEEVEGVYKAFAAMFEPMGLSFDFDQLRQTRPLIAEMLK